MVWLTAAALFCCLAVLAIDAQDVSEKGKKNLIDLGRLTAGKGPLIDVDENAYRRFAMSIGSDRPYNIVTVFTGAAELCPQCPRTESAVQSVAEEFQRAGAMVADPENVIKGGKSPVFFFRIDAVRHRNIAFTHDLRTAPQIALIELEKLTPVKPKTNMPLPPGVPSLQYPFSRSDVYASDNSGSAKDRRSLIAWINSKTGHNVEITPTMLERIGINGILMTVVCVLGVIGLKMSVLIRQHPWIMACGALVVQWLSTSGIVWSLQHGGNLWGLDRRTMETIFFMRNRRAQFLGEGLGMGCACVLFGALWLIMARLAASRNKWRGFQNIALVFLLVLTMTLYVAIFRANELKSGIYHTPVYPPAQFSRGPLMTDRGNSL